MSAEGDDHTRRRDECNMYVEVVYDNFNNKRRYDDDDNITHGVLLCVPLYHAILPPFAGRSAVAWL